MKTAISVPDDLLERAENLAKRTNKSRSQLFNDALRDYIARHAPDDVTEAMNRVCGELEDSSDQFVALASERVLARTEW